MFLQNLVKLGIAGPVALYYGAQTDNRLVAWGMYALGAISMGSGALGLYGEIEQIKRKMALPGPASGMGRVIDSQAVDMRDTVGL